MGKTAKLDGHYLIPVLDIQRTPEQKLCLKPVKIFHGISINGNTKVTSGFLAAYPKIVTGVKNKDGGIPKKFELSQNYPNPFNPTTRIKYSITSKQLVVLKVFDILGREVTTLVNEEKPAGSYEITFNATNLASGVYLYSLQAGNFHKVKKLVLLK